MNTDNRHLDSLLQAAEARERISQRALSHQKKKRQVWLVLFAGTILSLVGLCPSASGLIWLAAWVFYAISFVWYTEGLGFTTSYEDDLIVNRWRRILDLWDEFGRQGRIPELIFVWTLPAIGRLVRTVFDVTI